MPTRTKVLADGTERGGCPLGEALGVAWRLKPPHRPLALPRWLMRILSAIVEIAVLAMLDAGQHLPLGGAIAGQFIGDEHAGDVLAAREQLGHP